MLIHVFVDLVQCLVLICRDYEEHALWLWVLALFGEVKFDTLCSSQIVPMTNSLSVLCSILLFWSFISLLSLFIGFCKQRYQITNCCHSIVFANTIYQMTNIATLSHVLVMCCVYICKSICLKSKNNSLCSTLLWIWASHQN